VVVRAPVTRDPCTAPAAPASDCISTTTGIGFYVPAQEKGSVGAGQDVEIAIYNAAGQRIKTLVSGELEAGHHQVIWDGRTEHGAIAASGIYFCRLTVGERAATRSMVMVR